jgi:hypothetical protein
VRGKPYIEFLGNLDDGTVMKTLMEYLQSVPAKANNSSVLPQKWIESKIARIRKLAIETAQSLAIEENVNVTTMLSADGEQLIVKRTNLRTKDVYRTNHYITKAVNPHRVLAKHPYQSYTKETYLEGASGQALKDGLVTMDFSDVVSLDEKTLEILSRCEIAVVSVTASDNLKQPFEALFRLVHEDFELPPHKQQGYMAISDTAFFFVDEEEMPDFNAKPGFEGIRKAEG